MNLFYRILRATAFMFGITVASGLSAQVVTTTPAAVYRSSNNIVITFHADQGNKGCINLPASAKVYAHTGVIYTGDADTQWSQAPEWGDNSPKYELTRVGTSNDYTLTIPNIDSYYGIPASQGVAKLAFVFRSSTGKEGKTETGGDIFVKVYPDGELAMDFTITPSTPVVYSGTNIKFDIKTYENASIKLYRGTNLSTPIREVASGTSLTYSTSVTSSAIYTAVGKSGNLTSTQEIEITCVNTPVQQNYPGGTPKMGAIRNDDGSVTFCIAAPDKKFAFLVGSWNEYSETTASQYMKYQDYKGNRYFWTTVNGLEPGKDYFYYYYIDGTHRVGDPYARLILDPNDGDIPQSVFPDLPRFPKPQYKNLAIAWYNTSFDDEYDWQVKGFKGVPQNQLVIYEVLLRDFNCTNDAQGNGNGDGTIASFLEKLDYIKSLGVNAVELLPIMEFNNNKSWGYNTNFYFAPDKAYGTPDMYRQMIDAIHAKGMAVILDIVFNQTDWMHPWYQLYQDDQSKNPFYNAINAPHAYSVLNDWNQDNELVQQQFQDALQYWLTAYNVDGFRFDLVKGLGSNESYNATKLADGGWGDVTDEKTNAYNSSRVARMKALHDAMRQINPDAYFINEDLAGAQEENEMAADEEINWANINHEATQFALGNTGNLNRFWAPSDSRTLGSTVSYAESHDEERIAYSMSQNAVEAIKGKASPTCLRLGSLAAIMLMTPGSHMIWQFEEMAADQTTKNSQGNDTGNKRSVWDTLEGAGEWPTARRGLLSDYQALCAVRNNYPDMFDPDKVDVKMNAATSRATISITSKDVNPASGKKDQIILAVNGSSSGSAGAVSLTNIMSDDPTGYQVLAQSYGATLTDPTSKLPRVNPNSFVVYGSKSLTSGIDDTFTDPDSDSSVKVTVSGNDIMINGEYTAATLYGIDGTTIAMTTPASGNSFRNLAHGLYIVSVDGRAFKIVL